MRPPKDVTLMETAWSWAKQGTCSRLQVGAVIARDTRIIVTGYNGAPAGLSHCEHDGSEERCAAAVHAEMNAVGYAAREGLPTGGATLYVTHEPCEHCAPVIIAAGVVRVVYAALYRSRRGVDRLEAAGVHVDQLLGWEVPA